MGTSKPYKFTVLSLIPEDLVLKGKTYYIKDNGNKSKPSENPPKSNKDIEKWIKDWIGYAKYLEVELTREKRDHKDSRDWINRICKNVPSPTKQKFARY